MTRLVLEVGANPGAQGVQILELAHILREFIVQFRNRASLQRLHGDHV